MTPTAPPPQRVDVLLAGGGGAARTVLLALAGAAHAGRLPGPLRVLVVDPVDPHDTEAAHRTWCSWGEPDTLLEPVVAAAWRHVRVRDARHDLVLDLDPLRYRLVRSADLAEHVEQRLTTAPGLAVEHVTAAVTALDERPDGTVDVSWPGGSARARLVLDSRPVRPARPGSVFWWQHFRGWTLPAGAVPGLDPAVAELMDFRTPQPERGLSFGYVLPLPDGRALAEYTEFSPARLDDAGYDRALRAYLDRLGVAAGVQPEHVETGAIPMTDARFARSAGPRVLRLGTAGGATRGSTGYTFSAMLRDARAVTDLLERGALAGTAPLHLPAPYPRRHRWFDAVQLRALEDGLVDGPAFFVRLFRRQPATRVLRFLDGATHVAEDVAVMSGAPAVAMTRAAAADGLARVRGRSRAGQAPAVPVPTARTRA
ncbi:lycopene cyclase family protein [Aquipuribacter sp. SD81]|uniref:lycopene cyclase family protein n=1 Tax=Aquipuribacter sp. SD81 TaxID=3127703 RepID=UPI003017C749